MEKEIKDLRKRILPILSFCQSQKGDMALYESWNEREDAAKKYFHAYYSGLFSRILCVMEEDYVLPDFVSACNGLLEKYNWYDIQNDDLKLFVSADPWGCEVPDAFVFIEGVDDINGADRWYGRSSDPVCLKMEHAYWSFADVRGHVHGLLDRE